MIVVLFALSAKLDPANDTRVVRHANNRPVTKGAHLLRNVTIAVHVAKNAFGIAGSPAAGRIQERSRMTRQQFERFWTRANPAGW